MAKTGAERQYAKAIDYKVTFGSAHGKSVLTDLMKKHHMLEAFRGDPAELQFREGERFVVLRILELLKVDANKLRQAIEDEKRGEPQ